MGKPPIDSTSEASERTVDDDHREVLPTGEDLAEPITSRAPLLAGRYELLGLLGSGGMGTVYRAHDRELDELVALKVLNKVFAQSREMLERFRREVKLARKVTHVNVARTFDIGEHEGDRFLTMELVVGEPLSALASRALPGLGHTLEIARGILDGLAASHDAGVVHGDLKPANVLCATSGRVVITDFGIARALHVDGSGEVTTAGMLVGTPQYMAPEQVEGTLVLDGRADLYALGCMLFRLLTGQPAWVGSSYVSVASARLLREPPDPRAHVPELPAAVCELVLRCMARHRDDRFPDARAANAALDVALAAALPSATSRAARAQPTGDARPESSHAHARSVAVLPLRDAGGVGDAHLAGGITDDLIDVLSTVPHVRVRPRGAVSPLASSALEAREVGRALGVDAVVEGSIRRLGDVVRVALRLITVADGFQLWAKRFDRPMAEFFAVGDDAAAEVANVLASERVTPARAPSSDAAALELFLRGRHIYTRAYFDVAQAVALLRGAHERAPYDARIAAALALALVRHAHIELLPPATVEEARSLANAALERDPSVAEAHVALALAELRRPDPIAASVSLSRALERAPRNFDALAWRGSLLAECNRLDDAIEQLEVAQEEGAELIVILGDLARVHALRGDWELAEQYARRAAHDAAFYWNIRARHVLWQDDPRIAARLLSELSTAPISQAKAERARALLLVARDRALDPPTAELVRRQFGAVSVPRRAAHNVQQRIEIYARVGLLEEARKDYQVLEECAFTDLAWLDRCPAIEPLRASAEHTELRRSTTERVARVLEVFDAENTRLPGHHRQAG